MELLGYGFLSPFPHLAKHSSHLTKQRHGLKTCNLFSSL
jgi:hypothetical protein